MGRPYIKPKGEKKITSLVSSDLEISYLGIESELTRLSMSDILHVLVELARVRGEAAEAQGQPKPSGVSDVEFFTLLTLHDAGLLSDEDYRNWIWAAEQGMNGDFRERLGTLFPLISNRLEMNKSATE